MADVGLKYRWPGRHAATETCPQCGQPCRPVECEDGIGAYEAWGRAANDITHYIGSHCCGEPLDNQDGWDHPIRERLDDN